MGTSVLKTKGALFPTLHKKVTFNVPLVSTLQEVRKLNVPLFPTLHKKSNVQRSVGFNASGCNIFFHPLLSTLWQSEKLNVPFFLIIQYCDRFNGPLFLTMNAYPIGRLFFKSNALKCNVPFEVMISGFKKNVSNRYFYRSNFVLRVPFKVTL